MPDTPRFPVRFDDDAFAEDLAYASPAGRRVGQVERTRLEREGIAAADLRACSPEGRDGTRLGGLVKTYLPPPAGEWGMVLGAGRDQRDPLLLVCVAFGRRHPAVPWQPSVYQVAHRRLHADDQP